jgi:hypothetical protein
MSENQLSDNPTPENEILENTAAENLMPRPESGEVSVTVFPNEPDNNSAENSQDIEPAKSGENSAPKVSSNSNSASKVRSASKVSSNSASKVKITIDEALNDYYKLKSKYETDYQEKYIKPILRSADKSKREKRLEYQKLPKAECVNCKRNVGTIFTIEIDETEYSRTFIATCGDLNDPCPLEINFEYTFRNELNKEILDANNDINEIKNKIIIDKNNMMFGYVDKSKAIAKFDINTSELKSITEGAGFIMDINIQLNDNPIKKDLIKSSEDKLGVEFLLPFKEMIKTFDQTGNTEVLNKAVKFYVDEMLPLIITIRNLKYEVCYVDFIENKDLEHKDEKGDMNFLIQKKNSLYNLEYTLYGNDEVKEFVKGIGDPGKAKTRKLHQDPNQIHRKTRKLRPYIELVEEVEEEKANVPVIRQKQTVGELYPELYRRVEGEIMPHRGPGGWNWENENGETDMTYQRTWDGLSPEYQAALSDDEAWMKKTIDYFVEFANLKRANKVPYISSREFIHPDGLLLPPQKIDEKEYDYGNTVYNKILNDGGPNIWLTFLPKSNIEDKDKYKSYLNALASILGSKLRFSNSSLI